jgi:hypothetical protein
MVENSSHPVLHDDIIHFLVDQPATPTASFIDVLIQSRHDFRKLLQGKFKLGFPSTLFWRRQRRKLQDVGPYLHCLFVQVGNSDTSCKYRVVWMLSCDCNNVTESGIDPSADLLQYQQLLQEMASNCIERSLLGGIITDRTYGMLLSRPQGRRFQTF